MAYISTQPDKIEYSLPYSDGSGERLKVTYLNKSDEIKIDDGFNVRVQKDDISWLIDVLQDIRSIHQAHFQSLIKAPNNLREVKTNDNEQ